MNAINNSNRIEVLEAKVEEIIRAANKIAEREKKARDTGSRLDASFRSVVLLLAEEVDTLIADHRGVLDRSAYNTMHLLLEILEEKL